MDSGEWLAAWRIFDAARELPSDRQQTYVESESADPVIRRQVFELLASFEEEERRPSLPQERVGAQVGRYKVGAFLGRGGMGEVYAARDTDLGRPVALKFLRPEAIGDPAAIKRFVREAKAASALNHPNILTIHEVIDAEAGLAIAMELVEGASLRSSCGIAQQVERVIQIGQQIARGLGAAHQAGLIHRDIKPENILVRKDGYVKIVDFGLARRTASRPAVPPPLKASNPEAAETGLDDTALGVLAGTLRYMSPEQARNELITPASDIFSFGLVLYEITTGRHAFPGDSPAGVVESIQIGEPDAPSHHAAIPRELDRLISCMLSKDAAQRPAAEEIAKTLVNLERATASPGARPWAKAAAWAAVGVLLAAGGYASWRWKRTGAPDPLKFTQVTTLVPENRANAAAISPDGKLTAYANVDGVFVRPTELGEAKPLRTPAEVRIGRLAWSPDAAWLLASGIAIANNRPEVWRISAAGDVPRLLRRGARWAALSADGARVAFISEDRSGIWTMDADGTAARKVVGGPEHLFHLVFWSPDGQRLGYLSRRATPVPGPRRDIELELSWRYESADVRAGRILASVPGIPMATVAPLSDGRILFVRSDNPYLDWGRDIWEVKTDPATGAFLEEPRNLGEIPGNPTRFTSLTAALDGSRLMVLADISTGGVFVADFVPSPPRLTNIRRFIFDERVNYPHAWTADSRAVIFESNSDRKGNWDLFKQYLDQRTPETIVATPHPEVLAQLASDGRMLMYAARPKGADPTAFQLMRVPIDGGTPQPVPIGGVLDEFRCSANGKHCVLRTSVAGKFFAFHELDPVRGKGRELARIPWMPRIVGDWTISADGAQVAIPNHSTDARIRLVSLVSDPSTPQDRELLLPGLSDLSGVGSAADGSGWFAGAHTDMGAQVFFVYPDGRYRLLGDIQGWLVPSPDGRHVAFLNSESTSNAWVVDRR